MEREFVENPLIVPSFFQEIAEYEIFEKIRRRDLGLGTLDELEGLAIEAKFRLYDDILMKSPLWVELTENQIKKKKRNWIGNTQNHHPDEDPRAIGMGQQETPQAFPTSR